MKLNPRSLEYGDVIRPLPKMPTFTVYCCRAWEVTYAPFGRCGICNERPVARRAEEAA